MFVSIIFFKRSYLELTFVIISLEAAFQSMMNGGNIGKQIVLVSK